MQAVMAMNKDRAGLGLNGFRQLNNTVCGDAVVAKRKMDVTQPVLTGRLYIRLAAIHADDGFDAQLCESGERFLAFRLRSRINRVGYLKSIVDAGDFNPHEPSAIGWRT